jgi:hypothetical protein
MTTAITEVAAPREQTGSSVGQMPILAFRVAEILYRAISPSRPDW